MIFKLVFCGLLALAYAAPNPASEKCLPEQYEGIALGKVAQVAGDTPLALSISATFASDFKNQIEAFHGAVEFHNTTIKISIIGDYKKMVAFYVEHDKEKCTPIKIVSPQKRFCSNMTKPSSSFTMGDKIVDVYDIERVFLGQKARVAISLFRDSFTPATEIIEQVFDGIPQMVALQYGNITLGIKDKSVFDIPSYC